MFHRILLAVDGSKDTEKVIEWALQAYGDLPQAEFLVFHVIFPVDQVIPYGVGGFGDLPYGDPVMLVEESEVQETIAYRAWRQFPDSSRVTYKAVRGLEADSIVNEAKQGEYDLIVLGSKGHGRVASVLLGSVSAKVLHHAHCPVLVVR